MRRALIASLSSLIFACGSFGVVTTIFVGSTVVSMQDALPDNVSCYESLGVTNCSGSGGSYSCYESLGVTNCSGSGGSTSCYKSLGVTNCSGTSGSTSCYESLGVTNCSGTGGSTSCYKSLGVTNCSGTGGSYSCYESLGVTNCSGSGIRVIPTPTPTPRSTYVYTNPTPKTTYGFTGKSSSSSTKTTYAQKVCVSSTGLSESCKDYPAFFIEYCSASSGGLLQWKSEAGWTNLWRIKGTKNSQCPNKSTPYYTVVQGELKSKEGISLRVLPNVVNGIKPNSELFFVRLK